MAENANWWEDFFNGIALDFWRAVVNEPQTRREADFIVRQLAVGSGARLLDIPCGGGRLSLELATRGFQMTGLDISAEFIAEARQAAASRDLEITWHQSEMREIPAGSEFDGAFCFGNSFSYLDDQGNAEFVAAVGRSLKPGARFLIDTGATAESLLPSFQPRRWFEFGGITMLIDNRYDHTQGRLFTDFTFIRDGRTEKRPSSQRVYSYSQIGELLDRAGLKVVAAFSNESEEAYRLGSPRLLLVAEKRR